MKKIKGLKEEVGVTGTSLENARKLVEKLGKPSLVVLKERYETVAYWGAAEYNFTFNGFSWGYGGEGPRGLMEFLNSLGIKVDRERIMGIREEDLPYVFEV